MSKVMKTRIQLKADSTEAWNRASENDFKVLKREAIFYSDADKSVYPVPMKINLDLTGSDDGVAPNNLDFVCECATLKDIQNYFETTKTVILEGLDNAVIRYAFSVDLLLNNEFYGDQYGIQVYNGTIFLSRSIDKVYIYTECYDEHVVAPQGTRCVLVKGESYSDQDSDDAHDYICQVFELNMDSFSNRETFTFEIQPGTGGY